MRLIGLLIAIVLVSLLFVWWISLSLNSTNKAVTTTQQLDESQSTQTQPGVGPVDYSKQKVEEFNEFNQDRAEEIDNFP
jgi:hypothetical protein